ncbi:MAG: hypothetical protein KDD69_17805, partial [Bdellovibrionales bacterium]|nr:hypothetical protein [Bdellovibrionales bacterium]
TLSPADCAHRTAAPARPSVVTSCAILGRTSRAVPETVRSCARCAGGQETQAFFQARSSAGSYRYRLDEELDVGEGATGAEVKAVLLRSDGSHRGVAMTTQRGDELLEARRREPPGAAATHGPSQTSASSGGWSITGASARSSMPFMRSQLTSAR